MCKQNYEKECEKEIEIFNDSEFKYDFQFINEIKNNNIKGDHLINNKFIVFKSIDDIFCLVYTNNNYSIAFYNLIDNKKMSEIKNAHFNVISNYRHILDISNQRDLLLSVAFHVIKVWNINTLEYLYSFDFSNIYQNLAGYFQSSCFINIDSQILIIFSCNSTSYNPIKIYDLKGNKIKEIKDSKNDTELIEVFYDNNKSHQYYILAGNVGNCKSFIFTKNELFHIYKDGTNSYMHNSIVILNKGEITKLIESSSDRNVRIWNFHSGELLNKYVFCQNIYSLCL